MKETERIYRQKPCAKPPLKNGDYFTDLGIFRFQDGRWSDGQCQTRFPNYWLEEVKEPVRVLTPEQLEDCTLWIMQSMGHEVQERDIFDIKSLIDAYLKSKQSSFVDKAIQNIKGKDEPTLPNRL